MAVWYHPILSLVVALNLIGKGREAKYQKGYVFIVCFIMASIKTSKYECTFKKGDYQKGFHPTMGNNGNIFSAFDGI